MNMHVHQEQRTSEDNNDREKVKQLQGLATDFAASLEDAARTIRDCMRTPGMESPMMASSLAWLLHLTAWNVQKAIESTQEKLRAIGPTHL